MVPVNTSNCSLGSQTHMNKLTLYQSDCVTKMQSMPEGSVDVIVTDPPYLIFLMCRAFDKQDDTFHARWTQAAFRVLKPGGRLKAFDAVRNQHRLAQAMVASGFADIQLEAWGNSAGFPKSKRTDLQIDKLQGNLDKRPLLGWKQGVGGENLNDLTKDRTTVRDTSDKGGNGVGAYGTGAKQRAIMIPVTGPASADSAPWVGWGTGLKPAVEVVLIGRKPTRNMS